MNPYDELLKSITLRSMDGKGDSDKHALTLLGIALSINAKNIIELGVRDCKTTEPLLWAAAYNNGTVYSVDINDIDRSKIDTLFHYNWLTYKMDSIQFLETCQDKIKHPIDLVYIDDWHSYEHVKRELEILDRIVTPKTVIVLHDLMYGETCPYYHTDLTLKDGQWANGGPYRAVAELNPQFWEFSTIPANNGLTILRKKYTNLYGR